MEARAVDCDAADMSAASDLTRRIGRAQQLEAQWRLTYEERELLLAEIAEHARQSG